MATTKTVTVEEIINAAEKNGFQWVPGAWLLESGSFIDGACILGQAMLNLGVTQSSMYDVLGTLPSTNEEHYVHAAEEIIEYNDSIAENYEDALTRLKEVLEPYKDRKYEMTEESWEHFYDVEGSRTLSRDTAGQEAPQS